MDSEHLLSSHLAQTATLFLVVGAHHLLDAVEGKTEYEGSCQAEAELDNRSCEE